MTNISTLGAHLPASSALAQRAGKLLPLLDQYAPYADQEGRLAPQVVDALRQDGAFLMWTPTELGGVELDPVQSLDVLAITSYGDASAGWVLMAANLAIGTAGAYLGESRPWRETGTFWRWQALHARQSPAATSAKS